VNKDSFYLKDNESRASINPVFHVSGLSDSDIASALADKCPLKETAAFLEASLSKLPVKQSQLLVETTSPVKSIEPNLSFELDTPKFCSETAGIFSVVPQLSYDDGNEAEDLFRVLESTQNVGGFRASDSILSGRHRITTSASCGSYKWFIDETCIFGKVHQGI